jgi:hydrogenase maturation factor
MTDRSSHIPIGKLPASLLARLLAENVITDPRVLLGPGIGRDCAVLDMGDRVLVAKSDPVTLAADQVGWYAVHVNANDIATTGASPRWFLATALLPAGKANEAMASEIFQQIREACEGLGVSLVGGHTEVTAGLQYPVVCGHMLGEVARDRLITPAGARPGDLLVLTAGIAIEATALLAQDVGSELGRLGCEPEFLVRCRGFLRDPGISVVKAAASLTRHARVHAMHDPTEGGLATALYELATAARVGLAVEGEAIPVLPECRRVCRLLGIDPLGALASGALLAAVDPGSPPGWREAVVAEGTPCAVIGRVTPAGEGVRFTDGAPVPVFARDEVARVFDQSD